MNTHELALKTYNDLQKRKKEREEQKKRDSDAVLFGAVARANKSKYRHYHSRNVIY